MKLGMLKILALGLMLVSGTASASEPPSPSARSSITEAQQQAANRNRNNGSAADNPGTMSFSPLIITIPSAPLQIEASEKEEHIHRYSSADWWLVYVTGALVAITGALAIFTFGLWSGARQDSRDQRGEVSRSIAEAVRSANAMERVSATTRDAYIASERPWVSVDARIDSDLVRNGRSVEFSILFTVKNHGKSPAINVRVHYEVVTLKVEPDQFEDVRRRIEQMRDIPGMGENMGINVFPGVGDTIRVKSPLSEQELDAALNSYTPPKGLLPSIFVIGAVFYQSPFSEEVFQTGFNYYLLDRKIPGGSDLQDFIGAIPASSVLLVAQPFKKGTIT